MVKPQSNKTFEAKPLEGEDFLDGSGCDGSYLGKLRTKPLEEHELGKCSVLNGQGEGTEESQKRGTIGSPLLTVLSALTSLLQE